MSVVLPAPFSPSSALISPGWTTMSMWSLATRLPNRLVIPRSSSFTDCLHMSLPLGCLVLPGSRAAHPTLIAVDPWSDRVLGCRGDRAILDLRLEGLDLVLQRSGHLTG